MKNIWKNIISILITSLLATSTIYAFTVTVPKLKTGDVVSSAHWNTIAENFEKVKSTFLNKSQITTCSDGEVSKFNGTKFVCTALSSGPSGEFLRSDQTDTMNGNLIIGAWKEILDWNNTSYKLNPSYYSKLKKANIEELCLDGTCLSAWPAEAEPEPKYAIVTYRWWGDPEWCDMAFEGVTDFISKWDEMSYSEAAQCAGDFKTTLNNRWYSVQSISCPSATDRPRVAFCKINFWTSSSSSSSSSSSGWGSTSGWGSGWGSTSGWVIRPY